MYLIANLCFLCPLFLPIIVINMVQKLLAIEIFSVLFLLVAFNVLLILQVLQLRALKLSDYVVLELGLEVV